MKKGQARDAHGLLFPVSAYHPLVGVGLFELPRRGAVLAGRLVLSMGQDQLAQIPENVVDLGCVARAGLHTELPTEVENECLGVTHLDDAIFLPKEDSPHHHRAVRYRLNSFVGVDYITEHTVLRHPTFSRLGHLSPSFRDEWVGLPLGFYPRLYYKI